MSDEPQVPDDFGNTFAWIALLAVFLIVFLLASLISNLWILFGDSYFPVAIRGWLSNWWLLIVLYLLPNALLTWTGAAFETFRNKFDYIHPDDMDLHTGEWIEQRLDELGIEGRISVGGVEELLFRGVDAFDPRRDIIFLGDRTFRKRDPMFWSIGAHELGHALVHRKVWIWSRLNLLARNVYRTLYTYVPLWLVANSLLGWGPFTDALEWAIGAGIVAGLLVVIDEAAASILAIRMMRDDERVSDEAVYDIKILLGAALATYCAPLAAFGAIVASWSWLRDRYAEVNYTPIPAPDGTPTMVVVFAIAVLIVGGVRAKRFFDAIRESKEAKDEKPSGEIDLGAMLPRLFVALGVGLASAASVFGLVLMTWRIDWGDPYLVAVILATPQISTVLALFILPATFVLMIPRKLVVHLIGAPPKEFMESENAEEKGADKRFRIIDPDRSPWLNGINVRGFIFAIPLALLALYNVLV